MTVAERIRRCRQSRGLTQEQLAKQLGVTARAVQAWEGGTRNPGLRAQRELAELFDKPSSYFRARS